MRKTFQQIVLLMCLLNSWLWGQTFVETFRLGQAGKAPATFNHPSALAVTQEGILFVVDSGNNRLQLFDLQGTFLKSVGGFGFEADQFDRPLDVWVKSIINIYVADYNNQRIQRYDRQMNYIAQFSSNPNWPEEFQFGQVLSCAVNSQNDLFVLDHAENKVVKFNRNGQPERFFGLYDSGPGELMEPIQLDIWQNKWLLVSDVLRKALIVFDFFGNVLKAVEHPDFVRPRGLATAESVGILLADEGAKKIFTISKDFATITPWQLILKHPLVAPTDLVLFRSKNRLMCVILDGNQLIFGRIKTLP